jgi:hypothetical protein
MIKMLVLGFTLITLSAAETLKDQDMDGVPDSVDLCKNTPFLDVVDQQGCSTRTLTFPEDENNDGLDISFGYGISNNEDILTREIQHTEKIQLIYSRDQWSYSVRTGYFQTDSQNGIQDTTLKIKRKFRLNKSLKLGLGLGVKLPTYDFTGNQTDYTLYSSLIYYPVSSLSLFSGVSHTFINDDEESDPLQDINTFYAGSGYFFTQSFYANIAYSYVESKFTANLPSRSIMSTLFYKINKKWFTTLSYSHEIEDDTLNNSLNIKFGYSIW